MHGDARVRIRRSADRAALWILFYREPGVKDKQVCQIKIGTLASEAEDLAVMRHVMDRIVAGVVKVEKIALYALRHSLVAEARGAKADDVARPPDALLPATQPTTQPITQPTPPEPLEPKVLKKPAAASEPKTSHFLEPMGTDSADDLSADDTEVEICSPVIASVPPPAF